MPEVVVIGGGGHAKVLISVLRKADYTVSGYTDVEDRGRILGASYLGTDEVLPELKARNIRCKAIIGIGKIDAGAIRLVLQDRFSDLGFEFPQVCSPQSIVNEAVSLGAGTAVLDGVVVNSGTLIGRACILNTNCTVEHDCRIGDNVHIAPGATVSGGVSIGHNSMIGVGANVIHSIRICDGCLIGAGATVVRDITLPGTYVGTPVKRIG